MLQTRSQLISAVNLRLLIKNLHTPFCGRNLPRLEKENASVFLLAVFQRLWVRSLTLYVSDRHYREQHINLVRFFVIRSHPPNF